MDDFKVMYKILKYLKASMAAEEFDDNQISAARLSVSELLIEQLLIMMQAMVISEGWSHTKA